MANEDPLKHKSDRDTILGFDFGSKKIGVAVCQLSTSIASPLQTISSINQKPDWNTISLIINDWKPSELVTGISCKADGTENPITPRMLKFSRQLEGRYGLPVHIVDETLTTFEAKQLLFDDLGISADKLWKVQDQLAAQLILQTWINDYKKTCP